jgi:hypothetical protein
VSIAVIHGKLSPQHPENISDRSEDLLTSSIFGGFRYLGWHLGLIDWLKDSQPIWGGGDDPWIGAIKHIAYSFWPRLKNGREPDLALLILFDQLRSLVVVIEVKYLSGPSDWETEGLIDKRGRTGNQIADQILGVEDMADYELLDWFKPSLARDTDNSAHALQLPAPNEPLRPIHLLVSADTSPPKYYDAARVRYEAVRGHGAKSRIPAFWLSWTRLAEHIDVGITDPDPLKAALSLDLYRLLKHLGLLPFEGFRMSPWISAAISGFWTGEEKLWWGGGPSHWLSPATRGFWTEEKNLWWRGTASTWGTAKFLEIQNERGR